MTHADWICVFQQHERGRWMMKNLPPHLWGVWPTLRDLSGKAFNRLVRML